MWNKLRVGHTRGSLGTCTCVCVCVNIFRYFYAWTVGRDYLDTTLRRSLQPDWETYLQRKRSLLDRGTEKRGERPTLLIKEQLSPRGKGVLSECLL